MRVGLFLLCCWALGGASGDGPLRVGMDTRSPPWVFVPGQDFSHDDFHEPPIVSDAELARVAGLDIDVVFALGRRLGREVRIVPESWFDLESGLVAGRFDVILGAWTPSQATSRAIAATRAYHEWGLVLVVREDETQIHSPRDLVGRLVGHYDDPAVARSLYAMSQGLETRPAVYDDDSELFEDLGAGRLDAVIFDSTFARWWATTHPGFKIVGEPLNKLGYHAGVRREDAGLLAALDAAIADLQDSGEMAEIRRRWEGTD